MKSHRDIGTDESIEHHSLPGTNMAGKQAPEKDDECTDERSSTDHKHDDARDVPVDKPKSTAD
jgi:hypothetical protein